MKAIFFFDENYALSPEVLEKMRKHEEESHEHLIRLYIKTKNKLFKSNTKDRQFHIMTLDPIYLKDIIKSEPVA